MPSPPAPGTTVTLRVPTPVGPIGVVGVIESTDPDTWQVRRRDGTIVAVTTASIEACRVVPPPKSAAASVEVVEQAAALGWRAPDTARIGEWLLRAAAGFTQRANSALALGDPGLPPDAALHRVREWYAERDLPPRLLVPSSADPDLLAAIHDQQWSWASTNLVMTAEVSHVLRTADAIAVPTVTATTLDAVDEDWLSLFRPEDRPLPDVARRLLEGHPAARFVRLTDDAGPVAVARVAVDGRWAGLFAVHVAESRRRTGLATRITAVALREAGRLGARQVYLQVAADNAAAVATYQRLGFRVHHETRYAVTGPQPLRPLLQRIAGG